MISMFISVDQMIIHCVYILIHLFQREEEFEDTKGEIRIRKSKKNRQHNGQKDKQHTHTTKGRVTRTPLSTGGKLRSSGRVSSSCSTSGIRRVNLVTNSVLSHKWRKNREVRTTCVTYPWSFVAQIFHNGQPSHGDERKTFEVMTST